MSTNDKKIIYPPQDGLSTYFYDITQHERTEQDFREQDELLRKLLQNFPNGSVNVFDKDLRYLLAEGKGLEQVGLSPEQLVGKTLHEVFPQQEADYVTPYYRKAFAGEAVTFELAFSGHCYSINVSPLQDNNGTIYAIIAVAEDISERKELEQRKDDFMSIASHELKTPITSLKGYMQLLRKRLEKQGMQESFPFLPIMEAQIDKLTRLITDLLDASKIQAGRLAFSQQPVDVDTLVRDCVAIFQHISSDHTLVLTGISGAQVVGDKDRLEQVFINLIANAVKYSPGAEKVDVHIDRAQDGVIVSVRDYGLGIPDEHQRKIFERFYRVSSSREKAFPGLGMGLYISQEIVQRHGGKIWVESREGSGSTFYVFLPLDDEGKANSRSASEHGTE